MTIITFVSGVLIGAVAAILGILLTAVWPTDKTWAEWSEERQRERDRRVRAYVIVVCPGCDAKNKVPLYHVALGHEPRCGACKRALVQHGVLPLR